MTIKVKKIRSAKSLAVALNKVKSVKRFNAKKHPGKVKWNEDPLEYQKRIRDFPYLDLPLLTFDSDFTRVPGLKLFILEE